MAIYDLLKPFNFGEEMTFRLLGAIAAIMQDYLGDLLYSQVTKNHAGARKVITRIAKEADKLSSDLKSLDNGYLIAIKNDRVFEDPETTAPDLDLFALAHMLERLSVAASKSQKGCAPPSRGAPKRARLDQAISRFRTIFEAEQLEVELHESGSKMTRRSLRGQGADLLIGVFKMLDPHTSKSDIWGAWKRTAPAGAVKAMWHHASERFYQKDVARWAGG